MDTVLITGAAGFIGYHVGAQIATMGFNVVGLDNLNDYYDENLKAARIDHLMGAYGVKFYEMDLLDDLMLEHIFVKHNPRYVIHLAAQAGVRHSSVDPMAFTHSNLVAMTSLLEACKIAEPEHILYASSSSVYGNSLIPSREDQILPNPLNYYAATKRMNEFTADVFNRETGLPITGLRLFSAYGPSSRPDMAPWSFSEKIFAGEPITLYGERVARDFTFCDDVADAISALLVCGNKTHQVVNIGNSKPVLISHLIDRLQQCYGKSAKINHLPLPISDAQITHCDNSLLTTLTGYTPSTPFDTGIEKFAKWFTEYKDLSK